MGVEALEHGRQACADGEWARAHEALTLADADEALAPEDLELLATAAYMLGRVEDYLAGLSRAHDAYLERDDAQRAARCAVWIGLTLGLSGRVGGAGGWFARAERLVERLGGDCVEAAYLRVPEIFEREARGDLAGAIEIAHEVGAAATRHGDDDLLALSTHTLGQLLVRAARVEEGLRLFDEAMLTVTAGRTAPIATGIVYCGVILGCQAAYELRRAAEWTAELTRWCDRQPEMVAFSGRCLVHRAEIAQLHGAWGQAMDEVELAAVRCAAAGNPQAAAEAAYLRGELHRVRGELGEAEEAYRAAAGDGREPQPGLALLWLARGDHDAAAAAMRRVLRERSDRQTRARLLPGAVEVLVAVGDVPAAREAAAELQEIADAYGADLLRALAAQAAAAVALAEGDAAAALPALRSAGALWQELDAPYEGARVRVLIGQACRMLDDEESAAFELTAARETLARLGAPPDVRLVDALLGHPGGGAGHGLTARELEVLRLVAAGATNKAIAAELVLSDRTVDRHVSNILAKLGVASRAAATAYAYEHRLL